MKFSSVQWTDFSNRLFHRIFSLEGLQHIFDSTEKLALNMAEKAEQNGDENTAFNLRRYIITKENWCNWINPIKSILCDSGRELCHEFIYSPFAPRGLRMENYLADLEQEFGRQPTIDDARFLASFALADLADYITAVYDKNFSLIRYAEHLATSERNFKNFENSLNSPVLKDFLEPLVSDFIAEIDKNTQDERIVFCISVPFAGCFAPALSICRNLREHYGDTAIICLGGGYINTELRGITEKKVFEYADFISYDRGYGSYLDLMKSDFACNGSKYYKTAYLYEGKIINTADETDSDSYKAAFEKISQIENELTLTTFPDYSDIDFSLYPRLADDTNPMHRIWSDGSWLKSYMAHGCYWHKCAFCDTTLDYVCSYMKIDCKKLHSHLLKQAQLTGIYGIHFVDEACPPRSLVEFALENCKAAGLIGERTSDASTTDVRKGDKSHPHLSFWGNIRFEKSFTRDIADFLSYGGLIGVSGGIEIATGSGLEKVNKGTDLESLIGACCAFKEAGILVHAYMIYGFYSETAQDTINSMEMLRQMFASGLLDGSFWHKFVLTKHSTLFTEWKAGKHPDLKPILDTDSNDKHESWFAQNDIHFEGEEKYEKFDTGLNLALNDWMHGENLNRNVQTYFNFQVPKPSIPRNYIEQFINKYEEKKNQQHDDYENFTRTSESAKNYRWIGGHMICNKQKLIWQYFGQIIEFNASDENQAQKIAEMLNTGKLEKLSALVSKKLYAKLRENGLVKIC